MANEFPRPTTVGQAAFIGSVGRLAGAARLLPSIDEAEAESRIAEVTGTKRTEPKPGPDDITVPIKRLFLFASLAVLLLWPAAICVSAPPDVGDSLYFSTPVDVVDVMLASAKLTPDDVLYDLGCGDGWICIAAAGQYGCKAVGVDLDPARVAEAKQNVRAHGVGKLVEIREGDARVADFSEATVVVAYLSPNLLKQLAPKFAALGPGARVVSHAHPVPGLGVPRVTKVGSVITGREHTIYAYMIEKPKTPLHRVGDCNCGMCQGWHVVSAHGLPRREVEALSEAKRAALHKSLHGPPATSGCAGGNCPTRRGLFGRRR